MEPSHDGTRPTYKDIAATIRDDIAKGRRLPGDRLPTGRDLAKQHGVTLMTVQNAYRQLGEEGLVVAQQGRGTFIRDPADAGQAATGGSTAFLELAADLSAIHDALRQLGQRLDHLESLVGVTNPQGSPQDHRPGEPAE